MIFECSNENENCKILKKYKVGYKGMNRNLALKRVFVMILLFIIGTIFPTYVSADKIECVGGDIPCVGTEENDNMIGSENSDEMSV